MQKITKPLTVVADDAIPFIKALFGPYAEITLIPGHKINLSSITDADAVIVRSITKVDALLLRDSSVKFVGTATAGTDHLDLEYLDSAGIHYASAPGGNAASVVEYVLAALSSLAVYTGASLSQKTVGIVGYGWIGHQLAQRLRSMDITCLAYDPPLQAEYELRGEQHPLTDLESLLGDSDVVSLHVPLNREGGHATSNLIAGPELAQMRADSWLINTARGGVVNEEDLKKALLSGNVSCAVTDVWSGEPDPDTGLIGASFISTAHIAGYSDDAKRRSTEMILTEFCTHFNLRKRTYPKGSVLEKVRITPPKMEPGQDNSVYLHEILRQMYDIRKDDKRLRDIPFGPPDKKKEAFRKLRSEYPGRRGFEHFLLDDDRLKRSTANMLRDGLRLEVVQSA